MLYILLFGIATYARPMQLIVSFNQIVNPCYGGTGTVDRKSYELAYLFMFLHGFPTELKTAGHIHESAGVNRKNACTIREHVDDAGTIPKT